MHHPARLACTVVLVLSATSAALADVVHLRDGRKLQGEATWSADGERLEVKTRHGSVVVDRADVVRVEAVETPEQELTRRRAALAADDMAGRVALAEFCLERRLERDAVALLFEALAGEPPAGGQADRQPDRQPDPAADEARRVARRAARAAGGLLATRLDYHLVDGEWLAPDEYYPARGFVRYRGRWVRRELVDLILQLDVAEEEAKQLRVEQRRAERALEPARRGVDEAREALRRLERLLASLGGEKAAAEVALEGKVDARRAAEERAQRARRSLEVFVLAGGSDGTQQGQLQLAALQNDLLAREADVDRARRDEEAVRARLEELARLEAQGPQARAEAEAAQAHAAAAQAAAERGLEEARAAVERSARRAEELAQRLATMKREGD